MTYFAVRHAVRGPAVACPGATDSDVATEQHRPEISEITRFWARHELQAFLTAIRVLWGISLMPIDLFPSFAGVLSSSLQAGLLLPLIWPARGPLKLRHHRLRRSTLGRVGMLAASWLRLGQCPHRSHRERNHHDVRKPPDYCLVCPLCLCSFRYGGVKRRHRWCSARLQLSIQSKRGVGLRGRLPRLGSTQKQYIHRSVLNSSLRCI